MNRNGKWGILGCSRVARNGFIPGILESKTGSLIAIASRQQEQSQAWANEFKVPKSYGSYEELLKDPDIDMVYIPLPNHLHHSWVIQAARSGKHILCDKPLAVNAVQAQEMVAVCKQYKVLLMEGFMWRFHPRTKKLMELVHQGVIGRLRVIRYIFSLTMESNDWRLNPAFGGGALRDIGCYGIDTARMITGSMPQEVMAVRHMGSTGVDITTSIQLEFPENVMAQITCSFELPFYYRIELVGSEGMLRVSRKSLNGPPPELFLHKGEEIGQIQIPEGNQFSHMIDHFTDCVLNKHSLIDPAENGLKNMTVIDQIEETASDARGGS